MDWQLVVSYFTVKSTDIFAVQGSDLAYYLIPTNLKSTLDISKSKFIPNYYFISK